MARRQPLGDARDGAGSQRVSSSRNTRSWLTMTMRSFQTGVRRGSRAQPEAPRRCSGGWSARRAAADPSSADAIAASIVRTRHPQLRSPSARARALEAVPPSQLVPRRRRGGHDRVAARGRRQSSSRQSTSSASSASNARAWSSSLRSTSASTTHARASACARRRRGAPPARSTAPRRLDGTSPTRRAAMARAARACPCARPVARARAPEAR